MVGDPLVHPAQKLDRRRSTDDDRCNPALSPRGGAVLALAAALVVIGVFIRQREQASSLLERSLKADFRNIPELLPQLDSHRDSLRAPLERIEASTTASARDREVAELLLFRDGPTDARAAALRPSSRTPAPTS